MVATVTVGRQGRIVIPAEMRDALGLEAGEELSVSLDGTALVLQRQRDVAESLVGYLGDYATDGRSLVDELIAERRAAAAGD
ncbi:MAG: AbrB/MazE/SpoVT family DNA-binding domain-containing protein [Aeromicrobium sp.]|uniref:AbrB/MazE/SpoVT family DNA-binding domain-containing protein n=1 Tax=Aeromicrobium sp. TaxID=1871063 RepID=UPI0039E4727B